MNRVAIQVQEELKFTRTHKRYVFISIWKGNADEAPYLYKEIDTE